MNRIKITAIISMCVAFAIAFSGCTTWNNFKAAFIDNSQNDDLKIQIGILEPVTGADSEAAAEEIRGIQLANEAHPTVNGKQISLVFSDNKSDIDATETAIQTLISKKPLVILGSYGSAYSLAASKYVRKAKIPTITMTNTNPLVTRNNDYYFRVCYVDSYQGDLLARYVLEEKKATKAGVLIPEENDAALAMATAFTDRIKAETGDDDSIPLYEYYKTGQRDYSDLIEKIERENVDYVLIAGDYTDAANIVSQAAQQGSGVQFLGDTTWEGEAFRDKLDSNVSPDNLAFVKFFVTDNNIDSEAETKERKVFLETYANKYGTDSVPSDNMALGYDAYFVAVDIIDKASDDATSEEIAELLANPQYSFDGATGSINFNSDGDPIKTAYISTWKGKMTETIATINPME
ncbi:MAG: ABC transporter substrate-binding protein [Bacillota bacterium]|nr:ABC transporter substrate-binding protein [Bacillota bacterium]